MWQLEFTSGFAKIEYLVAEEKKLSFSDKKFLKVIEQTEMVVTEWNYTPPAEPLDPEETVSNFTTLDVMKKRASTKKGIACRYTCNFVYKKETILEFVGENTYVIDFEDKIDKNELLRMLRNAYTKFDEKFQLRKISTILNDAALTPLDESSINVDAILPLLE